MKRLNILTAMLFFGFVCAVVAWSDIINLKSGGRLEGIIREETDDAITLLLPGGGTAKIKRDMIKSVEKTSPKEQAEKSHKPKKEKGESEFSSIEQEPKAQKPERPVPEPTGFPDGLVGRRYSFVITPEDATPPYKLTLLSGTLPPGLIINERIGGIEGEPKQAGEWELKISMIDAKDKKETFEETIRVWKRLLTVGEDGTLKGFDGIQMAINMAQDFDEIRIQSGNYKGTGIVIPENKEWENGIKISGGWGKDFSENTGKAIMDGEGKKGRILTISNEKGKVYIENLIFRNSKDSQGGAIRIENGEAIFAKCIFTKNIAEVPGRNGGAIYGRGTFINCEFNDNCGGSGGAVHTWGESKFIECIFTNNKGSYGGAIDITGSGRRSTFVKTIFINNLARSRGGAVDGSGIFVDCAFRNNSASCGGAVWSGDDESIFVNCNFVSNTAKGDSLTVGKGGGGVCCCGKGIFVTCKFHGNSARFGGACSASYRLPIFFSCMFHGNSASLGGAFYGENFKIVNSNLFANNASKEGGGVWCNERGNIINCIFYKNSVGGEDNDIKSIGNLDIDYCLINHLKGAANFGPHNIMGDPKFADPENGNFSLRADSPCIDEGTILEEIKKEVEGAIKEIEDEKIRKMAEKSVSLDLAGNQRITGEKIDLGAYEWQGSKTIRVGSVKAKREKGEVEEKGSILGKWKGEVLTPGFGAYPVEVTINRISENLEAGTTKYPSLNCGETLWYLGFKDNTFTFRQQLNYNYDGKCAGGGTIKLKILSNNSLHWQSYWPSGRKGSSGTLRREQE